MSASPRAPLPTVLIHWLLVLAFAVSLVTGLRIAADALDASVSRLLAPLLPQGSVLLWHLASAAALVALLLAYVVFQVGSGLGRRLLRLPRAAGPAAESRLLRWRRADLMLYWLAFALLVLAILTGGMQYLGVAWLPHRLLETLHRAAAWGLVLYTLLHVLIKLTAGGPRRLLAILFPRKVLVSTGLAALLAGTVVMLVLAGADRLTLGTLALAAADHAPVLDGVPDDDVWQQATPVRLRLANGANLPGGEATVLLRGVHHDGRVYLLCEWRDPTRSRKHVPLLKTEDGWRVLQTAYRRADENSFYEDKLALMWAPAGPLSALASVHLGARPLRGEPGAPGGRGLHYTTNGGILDVWHWKSVRNANQRQADDNFFGPPLPAPAETPRRRDPDSGAWIPRYMAGYRKDPPGTYSGFEMNWEFFDEGEILPLRLPDDPRDAVAPTPIALAADASDTGPNRFDGWIEFNDTRPYAAGLDDLPVGTLLPSVLPTGRLKGDRGDIAARGTWSDGVWRLELSRALDTGSARDVAIVDGVLLWAAVFDHTQTRHAYHLRPVRVSLR